MAQYKSWPLESVLYFLQKIFMEVVSYFMSENYIRPELSIAALKKHDFSVSDRIKVTRWWQNKSYLMAARSTLSFALFSNLLGVSPDVYMESELMIHGSQR